MKNILFTGYYFDGYHGSMLHICEIAGYLTKKGFSCYCASVSITDEIKEYAKTKGLTVLSVNDGALLSRTYDYVWAYHFPILGYLLNNGLKYKKIHIGSLSSFVAVERPVLFYDECALFSVMSEETKENLIKEYRIEQDKIFLLRNLLPDDYPSYSIISKPKQIFPQKIAVISNHPPKELVELKEFLPNTEITCYGVQSAHYQPITPELISKYDVIVSIGKTVQYALGMGIPVYNYDCFGGSGYITLENINKEEYFNFSGRSYCRKITSEEIANEILTGYEKAIQESDKLKKLAIDRYLLSKNIDTIINLLDSKEDTKLTTDAHYKLFMAYSTAFINEVLFLRDNIKQLSENYKNNSFILEEQIKNLEYKNIDIMKECENYKNNSFILQKKIENLEYKNHFHLPKPLVLFLSCFIPKRKNRKHFRKIHTMKKIKIACIMCVKNEEKYLPTFLKHIEKYVDSILVVDDGSTDSTIQILEKHPLVKEICKLPIHNGREYNERKNREIAIGLAQKHKIDWVLCCDPDERFELAFLKDIRKIVKSAGNKRLCYHLHFRELWDSTKTYRCDGIWDLKEKGILFPISQNEDHSYTNIIHVPWFSKDITIHKQINYNLYHLRMIREEDREKRKDLYKFLDPKNEIQTIGYDYLTDLKNLKLKTIPKNKRYDIKKIPSFLLDME